MVSNQVASGLWKLGDTGYWHAKPYYMLSVVLFAHCHAPPIWWMEVYSLHVQVDWTFTRYRSKLILGVPRNITKCRRPFWTTLSGHRKIINDNIRNSEGSVWWDFVLNTVPADGRPSEDTVVVKVGYITRADSRFVPNQWETGLLCNDVSHWLGASLESALVACGISIWREDLTCFSVERKLLGFKEI